MKSMKSIQITDSAIIEVLCSIQQQFVEAWNNAEMNHGVGQTHDLPGGATYSGGAGYQIASFVLPGGTWVNITGKAPWQHWHDGWSYCRHPITPAQVKKVVVRGSINAFNEWLAAVGGHKATNDGISQGQEFLIDEVRAQECELCYRRGYLHAVAHLAPDSPYYRQVLKWRYTEPMIYTQPPQ